MIIEKIREAKSRRIRQYPTNSNRASQIGHPCLRYLVFLRTRWQEATLPSVELQAIFEDGSLHEAKVLSDLREAGFQVIEQQRDFSDFRYQLTGHIDGKLMIDGEAIPFEVKSMSPFAFQKINSVQDMLESKHAYHQAYPGQLTAYEFLDNKEKGVFILKNKASSQLKEIWVPLDYEYAESLLQKCEAINEHVKKQTTPPPIPWDENICGSCAFSHICLPEAKRDALEITDDLETVRKLERRAELAPLSREYERLDKELKATFKEKEKVVVGDWLITGKLVHRDSYAVQATAFWQCKIQSLQKQKENNK